MNISRLYDYLYYLDGSQDHLQIYIADDLSITKKKTPTTNDLHAIRLLLDKQKLDSENQAQTSFVKSVLENIIQGIDPELKILIQLNQFRKQINSQSGEVQARWRRVHKTYCSMYTNATLHTISKLQSAISAQQTLFKAIYTKDSKSSPKLPDEVLVQIFSHVNLKDLNALKLTCKGCLKITEDSEVKRNVFYREVCMSSSHSKDEDILKSHEAQCRAIQSKAAKSISLIEKSNWLCSFRLKFSNDHFIISESGNCIHIYNAKTKQEENVLELPHSNTHLDENSLYIVTFDGYIEKRNIHTLVREWEYNTQASRIELFVVDKDHMVFISQDKITKVDFATKKTVTEEVPNLYRDDSKCYRKNGWILQYDWDKYIPISILYPHQAILSDSLGCIPCDMENNLLYTAVKDTNIVKIFDLDLLQLKHSITVNHIKSIGMIAQNNGILYVCDSSTIVIIDLLTKKQLKRIQMKGMETIWDLWAHSDTLFYRTPGGISYIDFSDTRMPEINIFNLFGLIK